MWEEDDSDTTTAQPINRRCNDHTIYRGDTTYGGH